MKIDIYDFDKTMLPFDSGSRFFLFCLLHYPQIIICLPYLFLAAVLGLLKIIDFGKMKSMFFCFIRFIPLERAVKKFWNSNEKHLFAHSLKQNRKNFTVIISASPDFLLEEIAKRLEVDALICTKHSRKSGRIIGENCKGEEKIRRFSNEFPNADVVNVFSDSYKHDRPIFSLGQNCFHVEKDGSLTQFDYKSHYKT